MGRNEICSGEPFELEGFWWDARNPEESDPVFGRVRHDPDYGLTLELIEWQGMIKPGPDSSEIPVLHGQTVNGVPCTIFDAIRIRHKSTLPGAHSRGEWRSSVMAHGAWIGDRAAVPVGKAAVSWRGLAEWFTVRARVPTGGCAGLMPESDPVVIELEEATLTLEFVGVETRARFEHRKVSAAVIEVELQRPTPLSEIDRRYLTPLRDLVTFGTAEETATESLALVGVSMLESELIEEARDRVEIVIHDASRPLTERTNPYRHLLMPLGAWEDPKTMIKRWLDLHAQLGKAANLFFDTLNSRPAYIENWFLNLAIFAEVYHRTLHDEPALPRDQHEISVGQMLDALPAKRLRDHYEPRLEHADEQGFRSRMKHIFRRAEDAVAGVKPWRRTGLPNDLIDTRNSLTHHAGVHDQPLEDDQLFWGTRRLLVVLQINLMLDLQMPSADVAACVAQCYENDARLFSG